VKLSSALLFFFSALGVFNGLLISCYFLIFAKQKRVQNTLLGVLLLVMSIRIGKSVYMLFVAREDRNLLVLQVGLSACFLIGISLYHYILATLKGYERIPKAWKIHFLIQAMLIAIIGMMYPYDRYPALWGNYFIQGIYTFWAFYVLRTAFVLRGVLRKLVKRDQNSTVLEYWLAFVWAGNLLILCCYILGYFYWYITSTLAFSFVLYALVLFIMSRKNAKEIFREPKEKYQSKKIVAAEACALHEKLDKVLAAEEVFTNPSLKLSDLAKLVGVPAHKLSQFLNDNLEQSFVNYINTKRISHAKNLIKEHPNYTLEVIGYESGFSSKSNFYASFKKITGQTPNQYRIENKESEGADL
jgi:AraC-like DNA-binding protein